MVRIAWVNIPEDKRAVIALTYIVWIWPARSRLILKNTKISEVKRIKDLSEDDLDKIRNEVWKFDVEVEVKRNQALDIKRLQEIWSYRWYRHKMWLPVRWQSTATNARTRKRLTWKKRVTIPWKKG